jgi:hypothetical protein
MAAAVTMLSFTSRLVYRIEMESRASVGSKAGELDVIAVRLTVDIGSCREKSKNLAFLAFVSCMQR